MFGCVCEVDEQWREAQVDGDVSFAKAVQMMGLEPETHRTSRVVLDAVRVPDIPAPPYADEVHSTLTQTVRNLGPVPNQTAPGLLCMWFLAYPCSHKNLDSELCIPG